jgi:hypothetical protein
MNDQAILARHGFTPAQAANAMRKSPVKRSQAETSLILALVQHAKGTTS